VVDRVYERNVPSAQLPVVPVPTRGESQITKMTKSTYQLPFEELTLIQIKRIMDLCKEIYEDYQRQNPDGFYSPGDRMNAEPCSAELELDRLYDGLSKKALQELIALKEFGKRGCVRAHHWVTDLRHAALQLDNPNALEGHGVGLHLLQGLRNMSFTGLLPGMPVWES